LNRYTLEALGTLEVAATSDVGTVRQNNEDSWSVDPASGGVLVIVADGMGGAAAGEVASHLAVTLLPKIFIEKLQTGPAVDPGAAMESAFQETNTQIVSQAHAEEARKGMGTTCTAVWISSRGTWLGHVGDSRAYLINGGDFHQLTDDHTWGAQMRRMSKGIQDIPPQADHVLTECLGVDRSLNVQILNRAPMASGEGLMLCSDGVHGQIDPREMQLSSSKEPEKAVLELIEKANGAGGVDNATAVAAHLL
jgi:serine/threonine protein phosphatase PrpC